MSIQPPSLKIGNRIHVAGASLAEFLGFSESHRSARVLLDGADSPCYIDLARITRRGGYVGRTPFSRADSQSVAKRKAKLRAAICEVVADFQEVHQRAPTEDELLAWVPGAVENWGVVLEVMGQVEEEADS